MQPVFRYRDAYATYALAAVNLLLFVFMLTQGDRWAEQFYFGWAVRVPQELGALEWWKLVAANFVHRSVAHLGVNLVLLCVFSPFVEFQLGVKRFLLIYLASGIVALFMLNVYAMLFDLYVPALRVRRLQLIGGASAAVLGIIGARGALFLRDWVRGHRTLARNHFLLMLSIVLFQVWADLSRFNVAFGAHLTGAIIGFALGLLLQWRRVNFADANPVSLTGAERQTEDARPPSAAAAL